MEGVTCRFVKKLHAKERCKGGSERSLLAIPEAAVATPAVVAGPVDLFPFQR